MFIIGAHLLGSSSVSVSPHTCRAWDQDVIVEFSSHGIITDTSGSLISHRKDIHNSASQHVKCKTQGLSYTYLGRFFSKVFWFLLHLQLPFAFYVRLPPTVTRKGNVCRQCGGERRGEGRARGAVTNYLTICFHNHGP